MTWVACHEPPAGVSMPLRFSSVADWRADMPANSAKIGRSCSARSAAARWFSMPFAFSPPSLAPRRFAACNPALVRSLIMLKDAAGKPLHYDRVYYIGENDFYIPRDENGRFKSYESPADAYPDTV